MQINVTKGQNVLIVSVEGRMDTVSAPEFQERMEDLLDQGETGILMDFGKLEYVSSAGFAVHTRCGQEGQVLGRMRLMLFPSGYGQKGL